MCVLVSMCVNVCMCVCVSLTLLTGRHVSSFILFYTVVYARISDSTHAIQRVDKQREVVTAVIPDLCTSLGILKVSLQNKLVDIHKSLD